MFQIREKLSDVHVSLILKWGWPNTVCQVQRLRASSVETQAQGDAGGYLHSALNLGAPHRASGPEGVFRVCGGSVLWFPFNTCRTTAALLICIARFLHHSSTLDCIRNGDELDHRELLKNLLQSSISESERERGGSVSVCFHTAVSGDFIPADEGCWRNASSSTILGLIRFTPLISPQVKLFCRRLNLTGLLRVVKKTFKEFGWSLLCGCPIPYKVLFPGYTTGFSQSFYYAPDKKSYCLAVAHLQQTRDLCQSLILEGKCKTLLVRYCETSSFHMNSQTHTEKSHERCTQKGLFTPRTSIIMWFS